MTNSADSEHNPLSPVELLRAFLMSLPPGPVREVGKLEELLGDAWPDIHGSDAAGMRAYKLAGRIENPVWQPPHLSFDIERHGATVKGSTRAELQGWGIDITTMTATCATVGRRQLYAMAPPFRKKDAEALAKELAAKVASGRKDVRLEWKSPDCVKVLISAAVPSGGGKQTETARRKRFAPYLRKEMANVGWKERPPPPYYIFERATATDR